MVQTISDFGKKAFRENLTFYKNHSSILEIVIFNIFVNLKVKIVTFEKCWEFWTFEVFWSEISYKPIINQGKHCNLCIEISPKRIFKKKTEVSFDLYQLMTKVWILRERKCIKYVIFRYFLKFVSENWHKIQILKNFWTWWHYFQKV